MLTYHQVMTTELAQLATAAGRWDAMAEELKKVEGRYGDSVQKITTGPDWLGTSALAAHDSFTGTRYEYAAAQIQAKAIASLLRDAHEQFTDLKNRVESARDEAVKAGMTVSEAGRVAFDLSRLTPAESSAYHHDPDGQASVREAVAEWQQRIDDGVKAVSDADQGVKIALDAVVVDSNKDAMGKGHDETLHGFNADAQGDIEVYEARNAQSIATRINSGGNVSAADYAELDRSFRDNAKSQEFNQTFLNGMGAENTLKLTNKLNDHAYGDDKGNSRRYLDVEKGLANSLANAMQDPKSAFYRDFRTQLDRAGLQSYELKQVGDVPGLIGRNHGQKARGYQSLITLMQNGEGYSTPFLHDLADDIRHVEDRKQGGDPNAWDLQGDFSRERTRWLAHDPLDGVLGIMSKNAEASTTWFDPGPDGENDNLRYLLKERDWRFVDTPVWHGNIQTHQDVESEGKDARTGLGLALEAAATGHAPLAPGQDPWPALPHSEAQARIMHQVIGDLGPAQSVPANMREPLARALSSYTADTHEILGGMNGRYVSTALSDGFFKDGDSVHMSVPQKDLVQFMRGLSEDPAAYATMHKAESRYISLEMEKIPDGASGFKQSNPLSNAGAALGTYSALREDVVNDERMTKYGEADWKSKLAYHVIGGAVTPLYFSIGPARATTSIAFGDSLQRGVDTWAWQWGNDMKSAADAEANIKIADHYLNANNQMQTLVDSWAGKRTDIDADEIAGLKNAILSGHDRGAGTAQKYLTDTTN
ncbi:hypothetical protein ABZ766_22680 [Streptomyces sp. NPDC006670]|uniref:hypothetical protein n=1 Tax=Streptomyces sp. NPDC006670 TaxID=3154476 RepID=UPI0033EB978C